MGQTVKQYAIFNAPINANDHYDRADAWLFNEPVKTFDVGTPEQTVFAHYHGARIRGSRPIGQSGIESKLILKVRHIHYSEYVKVTGIDANV